MPHTPPALASLAWGIHGALGVFVFLMLAAGAVWIALRAYRDTQPRLEAGPRSVLTTLRALVLLLLLAMLAEPVLHLEREVVKVPSVIVLVDDSASMQVVGADGSTRAQRAVGLRDDLLETLTSRNEPRRIFTGVGSRRLDRVSELGHGPMTEPRAASEGTDLAGLVLSAGQRHLEDHPVAIVLLSDGRSTTASPPSLAGFDVPVFAVAVGDTAGPLDLRLDRVRYPGSVHRGDQVAIDAELVVDAPDSGAVWTVLEDETGAVTDSMLVSWPRGGGRVPLQFVVAADSLGLQRYRVVARDGGAESVLRNNAVHVGFEVSKDRLRVLYLEERPSWNAHFLARLAARDRRLEWIGLHRAEDGLRLAGTDSVVTWPLPEDQQRDIDLWIAGSYDDLLLLTATGTDVRRHIRAGAGLLVLAGDGGSLGLLPPSALGLLPLRAEPRSRWVPGAVRAAVSPAGRGNPILQFSNELGDLSDLLREAPPLRAVLLPLEVAPDADVLLQAAGVRVTGPLLAVRDEGEGRVAAWTGVSLWNWSFWRLGENDAEPLYRALMGNLLATLSQGRERDRLRLQIPAPVVAQGADLELRAVALDVQLRPEESRDVWLEWIARSADTDSLNLGDEVLGRARMQLDPRTPGGRRLPLPALPPGEYLLRVSTEDPMGRSSSPWQPLLVDPYSVEYRDPGVDRAALAALARRTGGDLLRSDALASWARELELEPSRRVLTGRLDLWASPWLLLPLLGILAVEWGLRKRVGLI